MVSFLVKSQSLNCFFFKIGSRESECKIMYPADVIVFEGILALYNKEIRNLLDMKIFVDTDSDTRLARRGKKFDMKLITKCSYFDHVDSDL